MLSAMENPDKELIAAALANQRRRHIERSGSSAPRKTSASPGDDMP
jgi:hypothetical protein